MGHRTGCLCNGRAVMEFSVITGPHAINRSLLLVLHARVPLALRDWRSLKALSERFRYALTENCGITDRQSLLSWVYAKIYKNSDVNWILALSNVQ